MHTSVGLHETLSAVSSLSEDDVKGEKSLKSACDRECKLAYLLHTSGSTAAPKPVYGTFEGDH